MNAPEKIKVGNKKKAVLKDRMLLAGVILFCCFILITAIFPTSKARAEYSPPEEKPDIATTLEQNMELLERLKARDAKAHSGYRGQNPMYPPKLKHTDTKKLPSKELLARMNAPTTFYRADAQAQAGSREKSANGKTLAGSDPNAGFLNSQEEIATARARKIPHPGLTVPAGEMIPATLETAINSELAGMVRAITTRDIYALSGDKLLIPKGSSLIGQFNSAVTQGQSRIFIVWNRVRLSNGVTVMLSSPSADMIGRSGQAADYIDRHFFERFGSGVLLSVLGMYSATSGVNGQDEYNSKSQYRMNLANSFQQAANQSVLSDMQQKPTLQINQGAAINIFVARDLDFHSVARMMS